MTSEAIEPKKVAQMKIGRRDLIDLAVADAYRDLKKLREEAKAKAQKSVQAYVDALNRAAVEKAAPVIRALEEIGSVAKEHPFIADFQFHYIYEGQNAATIKPLPAALSIEVMNGRGWHHPCRFYVHVAITPELRALHDEAVRASENKTGKPLLLSGGEPLLP